MKMDKEKLKRALPLIKDYAEKRGIDFNQPFPNKTDRYYRNAVSAIIRNGNLTRKPRASSYCYQSLFESVRNDDIILLQIQPCWEDASEEAYRHYIEWVINYSPWRHAFISKNINRILKDGVAVLDANVNTKSYVKEAAIALRMAWENYANSSKYLEIGLWWDVAQKVDPKLSYIAAKAMFKPHKNDNTRIIPKAADEGHAPVNYYGLDRPNYHLNGWLKESRTQRSWSSFSRLGRTTEKIGEIVNLIDKTDVAVNPFASVWETGSGKQYKREAFVEVMQSELPKLEAVVYG